MQIEDYDPDGAVAEAGGIAAYVEEHSGGGKVIAEFEVDWDSGSGDPIREMEYTATCNMTAQEIYDAALSGQNVVVRVKIGAGPTSEPWGFDELHLMRVEYQDAETNVFDLTFHQMISFNETHAAQVIKTEEGDDLFLYIVSHPFE